MTLQICGRNLEPDLISCNTMLNALATATRWHTSLTLMDAIWSPDAFSYNSALSALQGLEDQWFRALAVMDTKAFQPDLVTFTSIASSCAKALQWQSDVALLSSLQNSATEIDLITFNALSSCFGTGSAPAFHGWRKCQVLLSIGLRRDSISFGAMVSCAAWPAALQGLQGMQQVSVRPTRVTWNSLAQRLAEAQLWLRTFLLLGHDGVDAISFNTAICAVKNTAPSAWGTWQQGWQCFSRMAIQSLRADAFTLTALMSGGSGQEGGWQRALSLLELPTMTSLPSLNAAISCCVDGSAWQCALVLFEMADSLAPDLVAYAGAIAACHHGRQPDAAWSLLERLEEDLLEPDLVIFSSLFSACGASRAEQLLQRMGRQRLEMNLVLGNAVINSCESWEEALASLREFEEQSLRMDLVSYNSVLHANTGCVLWQAGVSWVEEANCRTLRSDAVTSSTLMSALGRTGRWRQVLEMTRGGCGCGDDGSRLVLKNGCMASASSGSWSWALASFVQLVDEALRPSETSYGCVVNACEKGQRWSQAILVFAEVFSCASCNAAMMACAAGGQWQEALGLVELCNGCMDIIGISAAIATWR
ncbi:unnamed protein product [Cladocopium goreaui]|uniref:Pentacotripeptide-repeat region of PRORP domain-containing protein n=1 Tax=Cladocopium goreaui TaxID=2562237 RepID=A0A9P1FTF0_9DINO|nr:unnamed protein product [Cladocopium goreaui]